jgi:Ring hydroxylating beta subunit
MSGISRAAASRWSIRGKRHDRGHRGLRLETDHQLLSGCRDDVLRKVNGAWKVRRRTIVLDANVPLNKKLSVFLLPSAKGSGSFEAL